MSSETGSFSESDFRASRLGAVVLATFVVLAAFPMMSEAAGQSGLPVNAINTGLNSTVFIEVERSYYGERFTTTGTGFFMDAEGHILTNGHVVSDWIEIPVGASWVVVEVTVLTIKVVVNPRTPREKVLVAKVVAIDSKRDLALIKASQPNPDYLELKPDTTVGLLDEVFVLGFPFGEALVLDDRGWVSRKGGFPEVSINGGRIASLRRDDNGKVVALQTDAAINPGNSGGPMLNAKGELVGVVYAKVGASQIGLAISPGRVWEFLQGQRIKAKFLPTYVSHDLRPVLLRVTAGALLDTAVSGRAVLSGSGIRNKEFDLTKERKSWTAALEFPPTASGEAAPSYVVHVFLEDENGRAVADHRYRIRREDQQRASSSEDEPRKEVIESEITLSDYARKHAAEKAVEEGVVLPSRPAGAEETDAEPSKPDIDLEGLKSRARTYYRGGNYSAAAEILAQIVKADPDDEISQDYLELARERIRLGGKTQQTDDFEATDIEVSDEVNTSTAEITVSFHSPIGNGVIEFWLDGESLEPYVFSFHKRGSVLHSFDIAAGEHAFEVELRSNEASLGKFSFKKNFEPNTRWTLRLDLASRTADPTAYLVKRRE